MCLQRYIVSTCRCNTYGLYVKGGSASRVFHRRKSKFALIEDHRIYNIQYTFTICILNDPNIFTPYFNFRLMVCVRAHVQSDSFLMHTFSTEIIIFLLDKTLIDILNPDDNLLTSYA